ncbi:MAG: ATP-grasp domain-containing protein [Vicinamibacterales bacterium]
MSDVRPIGIYYEHPDWFRPLFAELDRRGVSYERVNATESFYDATSNADARFGVVFNRMSPSAYLRGRGHTILYTLSYLSHLEQLGVRVINGVSAFRVETSKALQLSVLRTLGLPFPAARVINHPTQALAAAEGLRYPIVVKPNIGGSGAGIIRFDRPDDLARAVDEGRVNLGIDATGLVQEYIPARNGHITRVEILGGSYLYAINVFGTADSFNLCPADICLTTDGVTLDRAACPADAPKNTIRVEGATAPDDAIEAVERIMETAGIDVGGVEYVVDDRDGQRYYYDVNALSNFVADAPRVIGFDPFERLVDFLEAQQAVTQVPEPRVLTEPAVSAGITEGATRW